MKGAKVFIVCYLFFAAIVLLVGCAKLMDEIQSLRIQIDQMQDSIDWVYETFTELFCIEGEYEVRGGDTDGDCHEVRYSGPLRTVDGRDDIRCAVMRLLDCS